MATFWGGHDASLVHVLIDLYLLLWEAFMHVQILPPLFDRSGGQKSK